MNFVGPRWTILKAYVVEAEAIFPMLATSSSASNQVGAAIWEASSGSSVLLRYRTSAGTWNDSQSFTTASNKSVVGKRIAVDANGNAVATWGASWALGIEVSFHATDDNAWGNPDLISTASGAEAKTRHPSVAINDNGEVAAIWVSRADSSSHWKILLRERATNGTWSVPTVLYDDSTLVASAAARLGRRGALGGE